MLGQDELINKLMSYDNLPNSIILFGERGCGKHTLVSALSNKYSYELVDLTDDISLESINNLYISPSSMLVSIDLNRIDVKKQNMILKLVEEPPSHIHIVLLSESKTNVLDTILNRCIQFNFKKYDISILKCFITKELLQYKDYILEICHTPGQIKNLTINVDTLPKMIDLCNNIIDNIHNANYGNVLTISKKLNYKDDYDKIDCDVFVRALSSIILCRYMDNQDTRLLSMYNITCEANNKIVDSRYNKERIIELMLSKLKQDELNEGKE